MGEALLMTRVEGGLIRILSDRGSGALFLSQETAGSG